MRFVRFFLFSLLISLPAHSISIRDCAAVIKLSEEKNVGSTEALQNEIRHHPDYKLFQEVQERFQKAAQRARNFDNTKPQDRALLEGVLQAEQLIEVEIPYTVELQEGGKVKKKRQIAKAFVSLGENFSGDGRYKGGQRHAPDVSAPMIMTLSKEMDGKVALHGLKTGGGKSGIAYDTRAINPVSNPKPWEEINRGFVRLLMNDPKTANVLGPFAYTAAGDKGTGPRPGYDGPTAMEIQADAYLYELALKGEIQKLPPGKVEENNPALAKKLREQMQKIALEDDHAYTRLDGSTPYLDFYLNYAKKHNMIPHELAFITGKNPETAGGLAGRPDATGYGVYVAAREYFQHYEKPKDPSKALAGKKVITSGLGNVSVPALRYFKESGAKITGIKTAVDPTDPSKGLVVFRSNDGVDLKRILAVQKTGRGSFANLEGIKNLGDTEVHFVKNFAEADRLLHEAEYDVFAPSSIEHEITASNWQIVRPNTLLVEGANGPTDAVAKEKLSRERNVTILVDIAANGGGVGSSVDEMRSNLTLRWNERGDKESDLKKTDAQMKSTFQRIWDYMDWHKQETGQEIPAHEAADIVAVEELIRSARAREDLRRPSPRNRLPTQNQRVTAPVPVAN